MHMHRSPYVIIFIPAYNEEETISKVIKRIQETYCNILLQDYKVDIIVVDDGSKDKTGQVATQAGVLKVITHHRNSGLGAATRTGLQRALELGADIAVKIDADFQHLPEDIEKVIRPILNDKADCVFGTRFCGGLQYRMPFYRAVGNKFFSKITSLITNLKVTDGQTGLMAFGRRYLENFTILSDYNETQQLIIDSWAKKMRVVEVPVIFQQRKAGKSFISWRYPFKVLPTIIRLAIHISPLKVFIPVGAALVLTGLTLGAKVAFVGEGNILGDATVIILILSGIQILMNGVIADLVSQKR
jgi:glycosyltransferase involved in cell wall biosynthesis